ncbi:MAG TPA: MerR family transcriptional regulator [Pyrinomonadaceae bacterium]|jgi:DNA-binding transcriptional MerR regulator
MNGLESYRRREFRGVEELTNAAATLVERFSPEPLRGNVRLGITERTVRHYLSEDLLGAPVGQAGTSLIFNYGNLLRLLAVKKLLAEHWSVVKIKEFMTALDLTALEQLVSAQPSHAGPQSRGSSKMGAEPGEGYGRASGLRASERETTAPNPERGVPPPPLASLAVESARRANRASVEWIELAPGLEIKVRGSFRPPRTQEERERLSARFWSIIKSKDEGGRMK